MLLKNRLIETLIMIDYRFEISNRLPIKISEDD